MRLSEKASQFRINQRLLDSPWPYRKQGFSFRTFPRDARWIRQSVPGGDAFRSRSPEGIKTLARRIIRRLSIDSGGTGVIHAGRGREIHTAHR